LWGLTEAEVPGITGGRISIETASKVWNACGLRIGALVTDNPDFHARAVAENTAGLCSNVIGQYIFGGLAEESHADLQRWYGRQREYYRAMLRDFTSRTRDLLPGAIVSSPDASIYSVVDLRNIVPADFDALEFVLFCARQGSVAVEGKSLTLLTAPMAGFYSLAAGLPNPGRTQLRIAYVESPERMKLVPELLAGLLEQYLDGA
jgi:aspartate aminotransferase